MPDMFIWSLDKTQKERLTQYEKDLTRKWKVNNLNSISFSIFRNELNKAAFDLMEEKCELEYDGTTYTIEDLDKDPIGDTLVATVTAEHAFFDHMINRTYVYEVLPTATRSLNAYMSFLIPDTGYNFTIVDSFGTKEIENFGGGNPLDLFKKLLETFEAEFEVSGTQILLYSRIGSTTSYPYRSRHNLSEITKSGSARNLSTYIKGFGKEYEEKDMLSGESKNLESQTGTWADMGDPYWYTQQVGATFKMSWTGTGIKFKYYTDTTGGVWEFKLDGGRVATLSTYSKTAEVKETDLFRDAEEGTHTITATFKGDDESNVPSTGKNTSKGWVRRSDESASKTFDVYRLRQGDERYMAVAEYTSPLSSKYGIRVQAPEYDERFTSNTALLNHLKDIINDKLEISHEMTFLDLSKAGYPSPFPRYGDTVPYIVEELGITLTDIRIMEVDEYPEDDKSPTIVLGNSRDDYGEAVFNSAKQQLDEIFDSRKGKIKNNVLEEAVKRATEAINNSLTQIEYPLNMGILLRDPTDYNKFVVLRSSGVGLTTDGGTTYQTALTAEGIVANAITTGQLYTNNVQIIGDEALFYIDGTEFLAIDPNNQNKYIRITPGNLYSALGAMTIERADGYKVIDNGYANFDFSVDEHSPSFIDNGVFAENPWFKTENTEKGSIGFFTFKHSARYLYLTLAFYAQDGNTGYLYVDGVGALGEGLLSYYVNHGIGNDSATLGQTFAIDVGVPTGEMRSFYIRIKSNTAGQRMHCRKIRAWLQK